MKNDFDFWVEVDEIGNQWFEVVVVEVEFGIDVQQIVWCIVVFGQ